MDGAARLQLNKMLSENDVLDQTPLIRELKHSHILREDINTLIMLKAKFMDDAEGLHLEAMMECNFLFTYYTEIYNKVKKDEIDLSMLFNFIDILQKVEDGKLDQHEASFEVGTILKKIYVDSALRKAERLNAETGKTEPEYKGAQVNVSWKQFKQMK
jgi:hypothetical protein